MHRGYSPPEQFSRQKSMINAWTKSLKAPPVGVYTSRKVFEGGALRDRCFRRRNRYQKCASKNERNVLKNATRYNLFSVEYTSMYSHQKNTCTSCFFFKSITWPTVQIQPYGTTFSNFSGKLHARSGTRKLLPLCHTSGSAPKNAYPGGALPDRP